MSRRHSAARLAAVAVGSVALLLTTSQLASAHEAQQRSFEDQQVVELSGAADQAGHAAGLHYHQTHADEVTATNVAVAHTTCDGCRAVALSYQVVVADRGPTSIDVANVALALNEDCEGCESLAQAYQLVVATDDRAWLSGSGQRELAQLRRDLRTLARSDEPLEQVQVQATALMDQVTATISDHLRVRPQVRRDHDLERRPHASGHDRGYDSASYRGQPHGDGQGSSTPRHDSGPESGRGPSARHGGSADGGDA